ncbi:unnamed protein product [Adineta steineri]|uniref:Cadherin domain-containing protein n=1 Tax=Adineta steineri TaxID=433720 RepID=A0A814F9Z3_9BILA|nr:unnamed protein product [Adineta steineri]
MSTTSIKTYSTINIKENVKINTKIYEFSEPNNKNEMKLILLNLSGFERNYFEIKNQDLYTINEIDREDFLNSKKCFDRSYCLIELHILVNDGQQYWVIPIHIIDENDNKPQFRNSLIELKFNENIPNGYQIPFEGALDIDEGLNGQIYYKLECLSLVNRRENCFPLFELKILSQSRLLNQYDQLAIKFNSTSLILENEDLKSEYKLILNAFDSGKDIQLNNSMRINIKIDKKQIDRPKFTKLKYEFLIKTPSLLLEKGQKLGIINAKSNDKNQLIFYKILNQTNDIEINSLTGELILLNENILSNNINEINLLVESSYQLEKYSHLKSLTNVEIYFRLINQINNISLNYFNQSKSLSIISKSQNIFSIEKNSLFNKQILFHISIENSFYLSDKYILYLQNYQTIFSLEFISLNHFTLIIHNSSLEELNYLLNIKIKHELTDDFLPDLVIQLVFINPSSLSSIDYNQSLNICEENFIYFLHSNNSTRKLKVFQTNLNVSNFSNFIYSSANQSQFIIINQCQMISVDDNENDFYADNLIDYELCSLINNICYNITMNKNFLLRKNSLINLFLTLRPIEIIIFIFSFIFIIGTIILFIIICRLKGINLCLKIKNYLFYGKKYGLRNAQRLSTTKMTQRIHSIVIRESQSPSIQSIKRKPYVYNIDGLIEQEVIPSMNISPNIPMSLSCTSSIERNERIESNIENERTCRTLMSSYGQETKQLLEMMSSNHDLNTSRLASEV